MGKPVRAIRTGLILIAICLITVLPNAGITADAMTTPAIVKVYVNDQLIKFDSQPYIDSNSRTMIPVRFVSEKLGATVEWNAEYRIVTITNGKNVVEMTINDTAMTKNGVLKFMDTKPVIVSSRTMVPLRFVSEELGATVQWDNATKTVNIYSEGFLPSTAMKMDDIAVMANFNSKIDALVANDKYAARMNATDSAKFETFVAGMDVIRSNDESEQAAGFYGTGLFAGDTGKVSIYTDHTLSIRQYTYSTNDFEATWFILEYMFGEDDANKVWTTMMNEYNLSKNTGQITNPETGEVYGSIDGYNYTVKFGSSIHYFFDKK
ncbi:MAG: copper amine oxidase N-terminal domain-containing protein [Peptostreptococcaceae bacterium]|nr:copper amine oxidase N-terminal domain-containing protein [Peptostreptococcaceae bacterium]